MRPCIITDIDRKWALDQVPDWARVGVDFKPHAEIVDDGGWLDADKANRDIDDAPNWEDFVAYQIERFEAANAGQFKPCEEWSRLWRFGWWPNAKPELMFPKSAPKIVCPFFRKGTPEFDRAFRLATEKEKRMWTRCGIAQFLPDDKRLKRIEGAA